MTAEGLVRSLTRGPLNVLLLLAGTAWFTPTFGLLVSSLRTAAANSQSGWWVAVWAPGELTLDSYRRLLQNPGSLRALLNTALITLPRPARPPRRPAAGRPCRRRTGSG